MTSVAAMRLPMRDDEVTDGDCREAILGNAPQRGEAGSSPCRRSSSDASLTDLTLAEARDGLARKQFSARELTEPTSRRWRRRGR